MKLIVRYGKPFVGIVLLCLVLLFGQAMCDLSLPNLMSDMVNVGIQQSGIEEGAPEALRQEGMELLLAFASEEDRQLLEENYYTIEPGSSEAQRLSEEYPMAREEAICVLREDLAGEELPEDSQAGSSAAESALGESGLASSQAGDSAGEEASQQEEPQDAKAALDSAYSRASYAMLLYLQQAGESGELEQAAAQLAQAQAPSQLPEAGLGEAASGMEGAVDEGFSQEGMDSGLSSGEEEGGQPLVPQPRAGEGVTLYDSQQPAYGQAGASASQEEAGLSQETGEPSSWVGDGEGENPSAGQDASQQEGTDSSFDVSQGLDNVDMDQLYQLIPLLSYVPQESIQQDQEQAASSDSMLGGQVGVTLARLFYQELGVDVNALQSGYIWNKGLQMLGVALLGVAATVLVGFFSARMAATVGRRLRHDLFAKVESFSNGEFDRFSTASLITRTTNDVQQIQMLITMGVRMICYAPIMGIGGIIFAVGKSVSLSWLIAAAVVVLIGLIAVALAVALPKFKSLQKLIDRLNLVSREGLSGMMVVRAFGNEGYEERRFDKANRDLMETTRFVQRVMSGMIPAMMFVMNLLSILIVWVGGHAIAESTLQIGDMMAFIQYTMQIIMSFLMISMMFVMVPRASVSAGRIADVLASESSVQDAPQPRHLPEKVKGLVQFNDVSFHYEGADENVLEHVTFTARPGETTAFIGSTGSGKSTLINLIPRFYDVSAGSVTVDGVDVRDIPQHELRDAIGYVPQKGVLFSGDISSNLRYGGEDADADVLRRAAEVAQATEFIDELPDGFETAISQGGTNVSGGQRQRLSIARALVKKAPVYIFDDTFSALDFKTDAKLRKALKGYTEGATVLIVAQRVSTIMHAEQIVVLDEGRVMGIGTHRELLASCKTYREIAESQLSKEELA